MTKLLIQGSTILAQDPFTDAGDSFKTSDQVIPKSVINGYAIVEAGALPSDFSFARYQWISGALQRYSPPPTDSDIANFIKQIDADTDAIYAAAIGNRKSEYDQANADAQAYKAAGYTGAVPASVQSWATAKRWTTQAAADDILAAATKLASARDAIRDNRLQRKEEAKRALTIDALAVVQQTWTSFVTFMRAQLGI